MSEKKLPIKAGLQSKTINVDYLARVEGEGALYIKTKKNTVETVKLQIFEPPRFFEALLEGRQMSEAPDITARVCGICPLAYQMSAVQAVENALNTPIPDYIRKLRRLLYCGEWIESHTLHLYMLHAPDFLGCQDAIEMSKDHKEIFLKGLQLKKAGNEIMQIVGGREIHPINVKIGGFYKLPTKVELSKLSTKLQQARDYALETVHWVNGFTFPHLEREYEFVSLSHKTEYPITQGDIVSSSGLHIPVKEYENHFEELHVPHSTALQAIMKGKGAYLVGPLARYNLNRNNFSPLVKKTIKEINFEKTCHNPFRSIIVRALEILYACDEAIRIISEYDSEKSAASVPFEKRAAVGYGATEAPRGLLYHRYNLNKHGIIEKATLIPPTSQNQKTIEEDLYDFVNQNITMPDSELVWKCEQAIRNYDPCISCSAHFLRLERHCE